MFAVDWDGTCVEDAWPAMGAWLDDAPEALRELSSIGHTVIYTCRVAPAEFHDMDAVRDPALVQKEIDGIRAMLDAEGLQAVEIWLRPFKPPALEYIDNRARRFFGHKRSWRRLLEILLPLYGAKEVS
jgi:hypothetical protein